MVEATGFEPAASASRTQRSTKLSHASISIKFSPQNYSKFRICGIICGRSGIYRYFLYTVPPMKWLFVRDCRSSADFTLTVRYGIPNAALYQTEPHLVFRRGSLYYSPVDLSSKKNGVAAKNALWRARDRAGASKTEVLSKILPFNRQ